MYSEIEIISYSTVRGLRLPMESQRAATRAQVSFGIKATTLTHHV